MEKEKFLIEIESLSNSVKILDKVIIMKNKKSLKTGFACPGTHHRRTCIIFRQGTRYVDGSYRGN